MTPNICIIAPTVNEETCINRKGSHSINVQVVFDASVTHLSCPLALEFLPSAVWWVLGFVLLIGLSPLRRTLTRSSVITTLVLMNP